jgi:hypothetical protein
MMLVETKEGAKQAWHLRPTGIRVVELEAPPAGRGLNSLARIRRDGMILAGPSGDTAHELRIWDSSTGKIVGPPMIYSANVYRTSIGFSFDGKRVGAGTNANAAGEAKVWEIGTGRLIHDLKPMTGRVTAVDFSPDGTRILTVDAVGLQLWDGNSGQLVREVTKHGRGIQQSFSADFSADGRWFMTYVAAAGLVKVWDGRTGLQIGTTIEHPGTINVPYFSPDGSKIVTMCSDGSARLWDARTGQLLAEPMRHGGEGGSVQYSTDGRFVRTSIRGGEVKIWAVPADPSSKAPEWLLRLATVYAGKAVTDDGALAEATRELESFEALQAEVNGLATDAPFAVWAKWFFADANKRSLAPGFSISVEDAAAKGLVSSLGLFSPTDVDPADGPLNSNP